MTVPRHIVVAVSPDAEASSALRVASALADAMQARLSPFELANHLASGRGIAGIEIPRFAERLDADLIVLPRMLVSGEHLADAVTRRSRVPSLVVSQGQEDLGTWLVALDGSPRCTAVLSLVVPMLEALGATAVVMTVEPGRSLVRALADNHLARTHFLADKLEAVAGAGSSRIHGSVLAPLRVRHGEVIAEVLNERLSLQATVLAIGARPGGPPPPIPEGSLARRLVNDAPCIVLTVPI